MLQFYKNNATHAMPRCYIIYKCMYTSVYIYIVNYSNNDNNT